MMLRRVAFCSLQKTQSFCPPSACRAACALSESYNPSVRQLQFSPTRAQIFANELLSIQQFRRAVTTANQEQKAPERSADKSQPSGHRYPHRTCWKCSTETLHNNLEQLYFCGKCKVIQAPVECLTHFDVFSLPRRYKLDRDGLRSKMRELQTLLHPDKFSLASERERAFAAEQSAFINRAYAVLNDPVARAEYCLQLEAVDIESLRGLSQGAQKAADGEFLALVLEKNEEIEEAASAKDRARLASLRSKLNEEIAQLASEFGAAYETHTAAKNTRGESKKGGSVDQEMSEAIKLASKMRYMRTLVDQVEKIERDKLHL